jgi:ferredoxin
VSIRVEPAFLGKLAKYGAFDISACFNCGNCTAVCPLSAGNDNFPRKIIRYGQLGARDRMVAGKEVWLCYYCGECSDTCPRQAEPGEFMAAARRYAIASFDPTGISHLLYASKWFTAFFLTALSAFFVLLLLSGAGPMKLAIPEMFQFLDFDLIHNTGLAVIGVAALAMITGIVRLVVTIVRSHKRVKAQNEAEPGWSVRFYRALVKTVMELAVQKRFSDCEEEPKLAWYVGRRFIHLCIMWGFIGLGLATGIDYLLGIVADKVPGQPDPLWYPPRLLGTVAGIFMTYGVAVAIVQRLRRRGNYFTHTLYSDWLFLWLLLLTGVTGFTVEIGVYLPKGIAWMYVVFLVHVVLGMEVVLLLPFTKFAHAVYRPIGLFASNVLAERIQG